MASSKEPLLFPVFVLAGGVILFYVSAVLFGAPLMSQFYETLFWSIMMTSLIFIPYLVLLPWKPDKWIETIFFTKKCQYSLSEFYCVVNTISVVIGSWIGAPVLLLDWDTGWKAWPIPCCVGSLLGFMASLLIVIVRHLKS